MNVPASNPVQPASESSRTRRAAARLALLGFGAIALFFLFTEHRAHLLGVLPYLLLAACPLTHLFHHRGHDHHDDGRRHRTGGPDESSTQGGHGGGK